MSSADQPTISAVEAAAYAVPTDAPEADGTLSWDATTVVVVEVAGGGGRGLGWSYTAGAAVGVVRDLLADVVVGRSAMDPRGANEAMNRAVRNVGRPGIAASAISALDVALWDLQAKLLGVPLHRLLGGNDAPVPVYGSGGFTTYGARQLADQLTGWTEQGIPRVKIKIGESRGTCEDRDVERVAQARDVIGPAAELYVDANGGYTVGQACRVAARLAAYGVTWFEEPVSSDDLAGLGVVRDRTGIDVTAGEYGYDLPYFRRMLDAGAVDVVQADVTRCAGITGLLAVGALCEARSMPLSAHCAPAATYQAATCLPVMRHVEWFHDHVRLGRLLFDGYPEPADGVLTPDLSAPGSGLTLKEADAAPYRVR